jgi:hypothetical protein
MGRRGTHGARLMSAKMDFVRRAMDTAIETVKNELIVIEQQLTETADLYNTG